MPRRRNVHVFDASMSEHNEPREMAGMFQTGNTTWNVFYRCLEMCFESPGSNEFRLIMEDSETNAPRDDTLVPPGIYFVVSASINKRIRPHDLILGDPDEYLSVTLVSESVRPRIVSGDTPITRSVYLFISSSKY